MTFAGDALLVNIVFFVVARFYCGVGGHVLLQSHILITVVYLLCAMSSGVVLHLRKVKKYQILLKSLRSVASFSVIVFLLLKLGGFAMPGWIGCGLIFLVSFLMVSVWRILLYMAVRRCRLKEKNVRKVVLVGSTEDIVMLYHEMEDAAVSGYRVCGYFDDGEENDFPKEIGRLGKPSDVIAWLSAHPEVKGLYCCLPSERKDEILPIIRYCENNLVHFFSVSNIRNYVSRRICFHMLGKVPYMSLHENPQNHFCNRVVKRIFDVAFSSLFLVCLFPFILLIVAVVTKITMPGPIFFRQKRNGLDGREFYCLKFRSMRENDEADRVQATRDDPRVTRWGKFMRGHNIDEFPQFWNVLKGDMSIVGPRPHMKKHTEEYRKIIDKYMIRHWVKPGITGWSQINGFRGETKEKRDMECRIYGDIWYIENWSFGLDLYIIYKTVAEMFHRDKNAF